MHGHMNIKYQESPIFNSSCLEYIRLRLAFVNENSNPQNYPYFWFLLPEKCSVRRVIYNDEDDDDIDADAASEYSESLSVHDDY